MKTCIRKFIAVALPAGLLCLKTRKHSAFAFVRDEIVECQEVFLTC